ncbi:MAG TPA: hypothetical protein VLF18_07560 [Tahibacter sp.]|uniref:beta family protein n=1 Tax=Tahibacter sp. TaxID=2056211 RepID=UPI002CCDDA7C|nr:hypothetical protein [Tahibacter sp.]HSX60038.1 hypothetical protein [Tahibacter sp.]
MTYSYFPIVRLMRGERTALTHLSVQGKADVKPIFVIGHDKYRAKAATSSQPAIAAANVIASQLQAAWGVNEFYLNASLIPDGQHAHPLADVALACRQIGLAMIPVLPFAATNAYAQACLAAAQTDRRGIMLSVDVPTFASAAQWIGNFNHPIAATDLLLDLGDNIGNFSALGPPAVQMLHQLHGAGSWRAVAIAGTSIPENFSGYGAGIHLLPRAELGFWHNAIQSGLPYRLDFSDYTTVSTAPAPPGISWGFPINAKYTLPSDFLVCRGVGTTGPGAVDMDVQLLAHAQAIRSYPGRTALAHCWADSRIDQIAAGTTGTGNLENWVALAVNRHIEITRHVIP